MDKMRLAQALVPIADELDERNLEEEANELDEIIAELMQEASTELESMNKKAQVANWFRETFQGAPGKIKNYQLDIARIDNQLAKLRQQELDLQKQKYLLMQEAQQFRENAASQIGVPVQQQPSFNREYIQQLNQSNKQLKATQQAVNQAR